MISGIDTCFGIIHQFHLAVEFLFFSYPSIGEKQTVRFACWSHNIRFWFAVPCSFCILPVDIPFIDSPLAGTPNAIPVTNPFIK